MEIGLGLTKFIPLLIYIAAVFIVLLTLLWRIEVGIFFVVPLLPLQNLLDSIQQYPGGKDFMDIMFMALIVRWFYDRNVSGRKIMVRKQVGYTTRLVSSQEKESLIDERRVLEMVIVLIILWTHLELWRGSSYLGTGNPLNPSDSRFVTWKNFVMLPLLYFIVVNNIKEKKHIHYLLILMALSMLFMDRNFYHNFADKDTSSYNHGLRISGTFTYLGPNELAVFYAQHTAVIVALLLSDPDFRRRMLFLATVVFNYFCLMFLFSRGGYMAAIVSWIFFGFVKDRRIVFVLVLFLLSWRLVTPVAVQQRIDMSQQEENVDHSIESRYELWDFAIRKIKEFPVMGVGYNTVPHMNIYVDHVRRSLHNGYLEVTLEMGLVGILIFLTFFGLGIKYSWRLYRTSTDGFAKGLGLGFTACVLAVLAGNIAGSYWFYINVSGFFWVNLALVMRALQIQKNERNDPKDLRDRKQRETQNGNGANTRELQPLAGDAGVETQPQARISLHRRKTPAAIAGKKMLNGRS